jgi:hypothetical protein
VESVPAGPPPSSIASSPEPSASASPRSSITRAMQTSWAIRESHFWWLSRIAHEVCMARVIDERGDADADGSGLDAIQISFRSERDRLDSASMASVLMRMFPKTTTPTTPTMMVSLVEGALDHLYIVPRIDHHRLLVALTDRP